MKKIIQVMALTMLVSITATAQNKKILFVMSAADTLELNKGEKLRQTGVFLNEFYLAYKSVSEAGYIVEFATPKGIVATIDQESINNKYWENHLGTKEEALQFIETDSLFNTPITLEKALEKKDEYTGLIIPGGQGLMIDLKTNKTIPLLLKAFAKEHKPTGLICHAPSLILSIPKEENPYLDYKVNSVSPFEEFVIERFIMKGKPENRKIAKQLRKLGLNYKHKHPKADYAVRDRNLVTSQNPFSAKSFNKLYLEALSDY